MAFSPRVSVLMPSYNYAAYLDESIEAVLQQSFGALELIVCDDGSSDESPEIIKKWLQKDERVRAIFQRNQGVCATLRHLEAHARGEYVVTLGCDDVMELDRITRGVSYLDQEPACAAVFCEVTVIDAASKVSDALEFPNLFGYDSRALANRLLGGNCLCASSGILRRDAVQATGPIARDLLQIQDYELWLRLATRYDLHYQSFRGIRYRWHGKNMSNKNAWLSSLDQRRVLEEHGPAITRRHGLGKEGLIRLRDRQIGLSVRLEDQQHIGKLLFAKLRAGEALTERQLVWLIRFALLNKMVPQAKHILSITREQAQEFASETRAMLREVEIAAGLA